MLKSESDANLISNLVIIVYCIVIISQINLVTPPPKKRKRTMSRSLEQKEQMRSVPFREP